MQFQGSIFRLFACFYGFARDFCGFARDFCGFALDFFVVFAPFYSDLAARHGIYGSHRRISTFEFLAITSTILRLRAPFTIRLCLSVADIQHRWMFHVEHRKSERNTMNNAPQNPLFHVKHKEKCKFSIKKTPVRRYQSKLWRHTQSKHVHQRHRKTRQNRR